MKIKQQIGRGLFNLVEAPPGYVPPVWRPTGRVAKPRLSIDQLPAARSRCQKAKTANLPCSEFKAGVAYGKPVVRNLAYHVAPFKSNGTWRRNVGQLLRRMDLFNGRRIVAVVTGDEFDHPDGVKESFKGHVDEWVVVPNDRRLREVATFVPMLDRLQSLATHEVVFCAHAKGVTRPVNDGVTVHPWADLLYETCLDYWPVVERLLFSHVTAGSFKKVGHGFRGSKSTWHYSGTFYWLRSCMAFSKPDWRTVDQQWWGTESWPGTMFHQDDAATIFHQGVVPTLDLYSMDYLRGVVLPAYETWKVEHNGERT